VNGNCPSCRWPGLRSPRSAHVTSTKRVAAGDDRHDTGHVFATRTGRPVEPRNISRSFDRLVANSDLPRIVFHDLRRTAATLLKDLGVPARDAQMILGHPTINVTLGIYSEVFDSSLDTALMRMNDTLRPQPPRPPQRAPER
jgi:integrase